MSVQNVELLEQGELEPVNTICQRRLGKRVSPATIWRWTRKGVRGGIKLQASYACGCWCTTEAAFAWFIEAQTAERTGSYTGGDDPDERDPATERRLRAAGLVR